MRIPKNNNNMEAVEELAEFLNFNLSRHEVWEPLLQITAVLPARGILDSTKARIDYARFTPHARDGKAIIS